MSSEEYTEAITALEKVVRVLRDKADRVLPVLEALNGRMPETPDLLFVYPIERRRELLASLAAELDLTVDEMLILASAVARFNSGSPQ